MKREISWENLNPNIPDSENNRDAMERNLEIKEAAE